MKIQFIKQCGHHKEGEIIESQHEAAEQYIKSDFARAYSAPVVIPPKKAAPKAKKE